LIGVALGIVTGTALAASPWFSDTQAASTQGQVTASAAESKPAPVAAVHVDKAPERPALSQGTTLLTSAVRAASVKRAASHTLSVRNRHTARRRVSFSFGPHLRRKASAIVKAPDPAPVERAAYTVERYSFFIEGDVTVADYDESLGTIETHEGKTFIIGRTMAEGNAIPWQDYRANLHYRCDQSGTCTLKRAGLVVPNARLSL
jgi:hypothetical protein